MASRARLVVGALGGAVALLGAGAAPAGAWSSTPPRAAGGPALAAVQALPAVPSGATPVGLLAATRELSVRVVLQPRDPSALAAFVASTSEPSSPTFRRFLPRGAFAARFGPTSATIDAVRRALRADGLSVTSVSPSHLVLVVRGEAGRFAVALHSGIERWRLRDGALGYRFEHDPRLPRGIARDVAGVAGVSSLVAQRSLALRSTTRGHASRVLEPETCTAAQDAIDAFGDGTFTPTQEGDAYGLSTAWAHGDDGAGHTVALLEFAPYAPSDILTYDKCFQLLASNATRDPNVRDIDVDGGASPGSSSASDEPTLDIEELRALAPGADVDVYLGPNNVTGPVDTLQRIATDDTAQAVSISWGICEPFSDHAAETPILEQMAAQGQTVFSASGDSGSSDCLGQSPPSGAPLVEPSVDDPASQPLVTGVGGLTVDSLSPLDESVWNDCTSFDEPGCLGGSGGGGISSLYARPSWQVAPGTPSGSERGAHARLVPDLSVMGDPSTGMLAYYDGTYEPFGGTSMGAPLMAAADVVAAQSCSVTSFGFLNPLLYAMGRHGGDFDDVTSGTNAIAASTLAAHEYDAGLGYDMASGLGSPDPTNFLPALCDGPATATATPTTPSASSSWTVSFHAGATAYPIGATVTLAAPSNTALPSSASAWSITTSDGVHAPSAVRLSSSSTSHVSNVATLTLAQTATALDAVTVTVSGVTNPPVVGEAAVTVTDSVDALHATAPLALAATAPGHGDGFFPDVGSRTAALGSTGVAVTVFVGDASGLGVAGAHLTATASGHGRAEFTSRRTDDLGVGAFVVRDDHVEHTTVTVSADGVVVGHVTVGFRDPWRAVTARPTVRDAPDEGTAAGVEVGATTVVLARAADRLVVGSLRGRHLVEATIRASSTIPAVASSPSLVRVGTWLYGAYRSTSGHLVVVREHGGDHLSGWLGEDLTARRDAPRVTGDPRLVVTGSTLSIAAVSVAHHVARTTAPVGDATRFRTLDLTHAASVAADAVGDVAEVHLGASDEFVYRTTQDDLEILAVEGGRWAGNDLADSAMVSTSGGAAVVGSPAVVASGGLVTVAAVTAGHRLDVFQGTFDAWAGSTLNAGAAGASAPAGVSGLPGVAGTPVLVMRGADLQAYCATTTGALLELSSLGVADPWSSFDLTALARAPGHLLGVALLAGATPSLVATFPGALADVAGGVV